jgi:hypothetical protein
MLRRWLQTSALLLVIVGVFAAVGLGEVVQRGDLRVYFQGGIAPRALPRHGEAAVAVSVSGHVVSTDGSNPPQLRSISIAINRNGHLDHTGLPVCRYGQLQAASTRQALATCGSAIVGGGFFRAKVVLPEQSPFPSGGRVLAFNGILHGRHVVFAHVYGTSPLPQSRVLTFHFRRRRGGGYGIVLRAHLPRVAAEWGYVSRVSLTLKRHFRYRGRARSFLTAACPAPAGFTVATFPLARASFAFEDGRKLTSTLVRSCRVRGA